jgi:hypothetical protein
MIDSLLDRIIRRPRLSVTFAIVIVVIAAGFIWWQFVWQNQTRVFQDMLANNLSTTSVTKTESANASDQHIEQDVRLEMGNMNAADWLVAATQGPSTVTTESIGTPSAGYIRYTHVATQVKGTANNAANFNKVINTWGKSDGKTDPTLNHIFSQTLLDLSAAPLPPIGNLPDAERQTLLAYMKSEKIFTPTYKNTKRAVVNGRAVYTYTVAVQLGAYVRMMQSFAHFLGLTDLDTIDPSQYSTVPPITLQMSVDRNSHQLIKITYPGSSFAQSYTDWGLLQPITIPSTTIPTTELQQRIQSLGGHTSA